MHVLLAQAQVSQRLQLDCAPSSSRWRLCGRSMYGKDALIDARLAGQRAPAWVAAVGNEGIFGGVSSHCHCLAETTKVEANRPENFQEK